MERRDRSAISASCNRRVSSRRKGVVTLELLIWLPVLVIFVVAVIEFGIVLQVDKQVSYASRFGAKIASEVPRSLPDNPHLGNLNDPSAAPPPLTADSLKGRIDEFLATHGLTASCQVILEHNATGVGNSPQENPNPVPPGCNCGVPGTPLPPSNEYVRVTVCLPMTGNVPNSLRTFGLDFSTSTISHTTVFRYETSAPGNSWAVGLNTATLDPVILNETGTGPVWSSQPPPGTGDGTLNGVDFVDGSNGWAVGSNVSTVNPADNLPAVIRTTNGGLSWIAQTSPITLGALSDIDFVDVNNGWLVGTDALSTAPLIATTGNGGATWTVQPTPVAVGEVTAVDFISPTVGWAVGVSGGNPLVLNTTNGGANWVVQPTGIVGATLTDVDFVDASNGWAVGSSGGAPLILFSSNGGAAWAAQPNPIPAGALTAVDFVSPTLGWAVGQEANPMNPLQTLTVILTTSNGGLTWTRQTHPVSIGALAGVDFVDALTGYAVGVNQSGLPTVAPYILKTTDGGATWIVQAPSVAEGSLLDVSAAPQADE